MLLLLDFPDGLQELLVVQVGVEVARDRLMRVQEPLQLLLLDLRVLDGLGVLQFDLLVVLIDVGQRIRADLVALKSYRRHYEK